MQRNSALSRSRSTVYRGPVSQVAKLARSTATSTEADNEADRRHAHPFIEAIRGRNYP